MRSLWIVLIAIYSIVVSPVTASEEGAQWARDSPSGDAIGSLDKRLGGRGRIGLGIFKQQPHFQVLDEWIPRNMLQKRPGARFIGGRAAGWPMIWRQLRPSKRELSPYAYSIYPDAFDDEDYLSGNSLRTDAKRAGGRYIPWNSVLPWPRNYHFVHDY